MSLLECWNKAQDTIKEQVGETSYDTWFSTLNIKENSPDDILIEAPDDFFKNWIVEHYFSTIQETLNTTAGRDVTINFSVNSNLIQKPAQSQTSVMERSFEEAIKPKLRLNPRFTFENFVIGPSNRFCYAAALAVAESPAKAYNPLFIYGPVGLGKTHLMQAITHKLQETHPEVKISYLTSEKFTNELIDSIKNRSTAQFRQKYRNIDVLLIDDIHFIAGKESTQEEFFHTFNALHDSRKQIIISSDRPPKEIAKLEERLSSRFAWGLISDIQTPDFETRVAILRKKLEHEAIEVPEDVIFFIAEQIKTNIRELEGALIRVIAYSLLEDKVVSLENAQAVLKDMVKETVRSVTIENIQKKVADFFQISLADMRAKKRNRNLVLPRQIAMYLSRKLTTMSLPEIGNAFGGKDHTTVLHSCRKIEQNRMSDSNLQNTIDRLTTTITH